MFYLTCLKVLELNLLKKKHCTSDLIIFIDSILSYWFFFLVSDINKLKINERQNLLIIKMLSLNILCSVASWVNLFSVFLRNFWYPSIRFSKWLPNLGWSLDILTKKKKKN